MNSQGNENGREFISNPGSNLTLSTSMLGYLRRNRGQTTAQQLAEWGLRSVNALSSQLSELFLPIAEAVKSAYEVAQQYNDPLSQGQENLGVPILPGASDTDSVYDYSVVVSSHDANGALLYDQMIHVQSPVALTALQVEQSAYSAFDNQAPPLSPPATSNQISRSVTQSTRVVSVMVVPK